VESTATLPLHIAAEEAWMSITRRARDRRPVADLDKRERPRLGGGPRRPAL